MRRRCKLQVQETVEELKDLLKQQNTASRLEKIQALYLFQTGQIKTVTGIARLLGKNRTTIQRWWQKYQQGGIHDMLGENNHTPGRKSKIPKDVLEDLFVKLSHEKQLKNYEQIRKWLAAEHGIQTSYSVVYKTMRNYFNSRSLSLR